MKRPAVFFDRDNTLIANDGYLGDASQVQLITGAADAVAKVRELGYATVIVSNQSGVARGLFDETAVRAVDARMAELLLAQNPAAIIDRHEYCPFHPQAVVDQYRQDSPLRKPKPGMLLTAAAAMGLDLSRSWLIGDAPRDSHTGSATPTGIAAQGSGQVQVEAGVDGDVVTALRAKGHQVLRSRGGFGGYQGILIDWEHGVLHGASESRKDGAAVGY